MTFEALEAYTVPRLPVYLFPQCTILMEEICDNNKIKISKLFLTLLIGFFSGEI